MTFEKTPIISKNTSWITGWTNPSCLTSYFIRFSIRNSLLSSLIKELTSLKGQLWTPPISPSHIIDDQHPIRFGTEPLTRSVNMITDYKFIPHINEIFNLIKLSNPNLTLDDLTGFNYKSINPLTHLFVEDYSVDIQTQTSLSHKIFFINYNPDYEIIIMNLIYKYYQEHDVHVWPADHIVV